jgi:hypothetical protein
VASSIHRWHCLVKSLADRRSCYQIDIDPPLGPIYSPLISNHGRAKGNFSITARGFFLHGLFFRREFSDDKQDGISYRRTENIDTGTCLSYTLYRPSFKELSITFPLEFQYPQYACFPGTSGDGLLFYVSFPGSRCLESTSYRERSSMYTLLNSKWSVHVIALCQILAYHQSVTFV